MRKTSFVLAALAAVAFTAPASAGPKHCPPGLAKQGKCEAGMTTVPPGHQNDGARDRSVHHDRDRYVRWNRWREAGLDPAPTGQIYVVRENEVILMDENTRDIIRVVGAISALLD